MPKKQNDHPKIAQDNDNDNDYYEEDYTAGYNENDDYYGNE